MWNGWRLRIIKRTSYSLLEHSAERDRQHGTGELMMNELKKCPLCGSKVKWCGENEPDPEDNHLCDHIQCTNADCGADFSFIHNNDIYPDNSDDMTPEELMKIDRDYSAHRFNRRANSE